MEIWKKIFLQHIDSFANEVIAEAVSPDLQKYYEHAQC